MAQKISNGEILEKREPVKNGKENKLPETKASKETDEERRERFANELIEEEEREMKLKKKKSSSSTSIASSGSSRKSK